jgi:site-specific DNA-methyltransferase (adenine-specific)
VIFSVGFAMQQLGFKLLNEITWEKPNPPPNLSCRYFTHSTETILWAAREAKSKHKFNYQLMRRQNGDRQMKSVWKFTAPTGAEKQFGAHPTQKPLALLERIIAAASDAGDLVVDPFVGSGTTGIAATRMGRRFIGIDTEAKFLDLAIERYRAAQAQPQEASK